MAGLFDPLNPLQGLENIPGANQITGADNFVTSGQFTGFAQQAIPSLIRGDNPLLSIGLGGLGAIQGGQTAASNLANIAKTRQDIVKGGLDITQTGLNIQDKDFDLALKRRTRAKLLETIYNMPPEQQALAESNPEAFTKMLIDQFKPTNSMVEYKLAKSEGYKGTYTDYVKEVEKFRAPSTTVSYGSKNPYGKVILEKEAEYTNKLLNDQLPLAQKNVNDLYRTFELIEQGDPDTGIFEPFRTGLRRVQLDLGITGSEEERLAKAKTLTDTQLLNAVLGQEVFKAISALGIGARGIDTPNEREFLREVLAGKVTLEKDTLKRMIETRLAKEKEVIDKYNTDLKRGRFKRYVDELGIDLDPIEIKDPRKQQSNTIRVDY